MQEFSVKLNNIECFILTSFCRNQQIFLGLRKNDDYNIENVNDSKHGKGLPAIIKIV